MKRIYSILPLLLLAGCVSQPYNMKFGGNSVSAMTSSGTYTYVGDSFGFPYYGPYSWSWYDPVWYSPVSGPHYSWHCPGCLWSDPTNRPGNPGGYGVPVPSGKRSALPPIDYRLDKRPMPPVQLSDAVVQTQKRTTYGNSMMAYRAPTMKTRASYQTSKPGYNKMPTSPSAFRSASPRMSASSTPSPRQQMPSKYSRGPGRN